MKNSQKAKHIVLFCMLAVGLISAFMILKTFRPSPGKPFEQITMEQAKTFMQYEMGYILADVSTEEDYEAQHPSGAVNIPYEKLGILAGTMLPDKEQQIYICGNNRKQSVMAASKLCEMGYTNISEIEDAYP